MLNVISLAFLFVLYYKIIACVSQCEACVLFHYLMTYLGKMNSWWWWVLLWYTTIVNITVKPLMSSKMTKARPDISLQCFQRKRLDTPPCIKLSEFPRRLGYAPCRIMNIIPSVCLCMLFLPINLFSMLWHMQANKPPLMLHLPYDSRWKTPHWNKIGMEK